MATFLYRLGRASFRHRKAVLAGWLLLFVAAIAGALTLSGKTQDSFNLPGLESTDAFSLMEERTDTATDGATARIVYQSDEKGGLTTDEAKSTIAESLKQVDSKHVVSVADPFQSGTVSPDGETAYATVTYDVPGVELTDADKNALESAEDPVADTGIDVAIGGDALMEIPETGTGELFGILLAAIILVITFGSLIAAGMPLITAVIGTGIGVMGITTATGFIDLGSSTPILASMLGLAVAIDYALFIVSRYRHELAKGIDPEEAAGRAVGTAGSAVVFAGLTVTIALAGLSVVGISFLTEMGLAAVVTVVMAVLIALTLLPALLGFAGKRILNSRFGWLRKRDPEKQDGTKNANGRRWVNFVTGHRVLVFLGGLVAAAVIAVPVASMQLSLPDDGSQPEGSGPRVAYDAISDSFGAGANGPLLVLVDTKGSDDPKGDVATITEAVSGVTDDVQALIPAAPPEPAANAPQAEKQAYQQQLQAFEQGLEGAQLAQITVVPKSGPAEADTADLVHDLRDAIGDVESDTASTAYVTGQTAVSVDVSQKLADVFPIYLALVVGLAFLLLMLVFRSILVPLKAVLGFMVTVGISLGATVAVFQWGWAADLIGVDKPGPLMAMLPILLVGILFGLAMDYEVFLVSRMREEHVHGMDAQQAITEGFSHGARVVSAAAVIMIGVFGSFMFSGDAIIMPIAFGLAVGILADAFLVRMTLVPALMSIVGEKMWWLPKWLDKVLPNLDIEGEGLRRDLDADGRVAGGAGAATTGPTGPTGTGATGKHVDPDAHVDEPEVTVPDTGKHSAS